MPPLLDAFCVNSFGHMVAVSICEGDPGTRFLVLEDENGVIEVPMSEAESLISAIRAAEVAGR